MLRILLLTFMVLPWSAPAVAQEADSFEDPVLPLAAKTQRTEEQSLRLISRAWYGEARLQLRREDYAGALTGYQRAWRYNPQADAILPRIVLLAAQLRRPEVAGRYLAHVEDLSRINPALLRQLGLQLSARGQWETAIRLFEHTLPPAPETEGQTPDDLATLLLHLELGRLHFLTKNYARAADSFEIVRRALERPELLEQNPALKQALLKDPPRTYRMLAEGFLQAGRWAAAEAMFRRALNRPEQSGSLQLQLARIAAGQEQTEAAFRHLEKALATDLEDAGTEPYRLLATLIGQKHKNPDEARGKLFARLESMIEDDGTNLDLRFFTADEYLAAERLADAQRHLEAIQVLDASGAVLERLVDVYRRTDDRQRLMETLELALVRNGSLDAVQSTLADVLADADLVRHLLKLGTVREDSVPEDSVPEDAVPEDAVPEDAVPEDAVPEDAVPEDAVNNDRPIPSAGTQIAAAWLALLSGDPDSAQKRLERGLQAAGPEAPYVSDPRLWLNWGLECLVAGQYDPAAAALGRAVELAAEDSQKSVALFYRSRALALAGQTESALQAAHEAHRLQPDSPRIRTQPAWVEYYGKRYSAAIEQYEELLDELGDQYQSAELRDVVRDMRLALSNLYLLQEDRPRAEECLEQVLDEFPDDIGALNDLGYLWTEEGKYLGRALTMIQAAVEGEPENSAYRDSLGWAYYRLGRFAEAVTELEKACQDEQTDGVILDHLGDAYLSLDRVDQAIAAWERAVEAFADEEDVARRKATQEKIRKHRDAVRAGE